MWLKTLGLILVIASCSGIGAEAVHRLRERLRLLETLRRMASHMKGEILYANVPLAEALYRTGKRNKALPVNCSSRLQQSWNRRRERALKQSGEQKRGSLPPAAYLIRRNRNSSCGLGKAWGTWIVICRKRQSYFIWKIWSIP